MASTFLTLVQTAMIEMGLTAPAFVIGNTTADVTQISALTNALGRELREEHEWQALTSEYRFTTEYLTTTGDTTSGSAVVTNIPDTTGLAAGTWMASGTGIPQDTYISSVDSGTQVTLSALATSSTTGGAVYFGKTKYPMPSDYDRLINRTQWDKTRHWEVLGPETAQMWQWLKSGWIATGPRIRYRIMGGYYQIWPMITGAESLGYEYLSSYWVRDSSGNPKAAFTADDDVCIFSDALMINGIKMRYFGVKGFDATRFEATFNRQLNIAKANDAGAGILHQGGTPLQILIGPQNIPDSGYGQ